METKLSQAGRMDKVFDLILDHPWMVLILTLSLTVLCAAGLGGLSTSNDYRSFLDDDYPGIIQLEEVESLFAENKAGTILITPHKGEIFSKRGMEAVRELTEEAWGIDRVKRVDSIANFQYTRADGDDLFVEDLLPLDLEIDSERISLVREISQSDPATQRLLVSDDGTVTAIGLTFEFGGSDALNSDERDRVVGQLLELLDKYREAYPEFRFLETGTFFVDYYSDYILREINEILMPIMLVIMMVLLAVLLRSMSGLVASTVVVIGSGVVTMGIFGWSNMLLEAVAAMGPIVIMTLAVADSVHIIIGAQSALGRGLEKRDAIKESLRVNFAPVFLTSLTTALGVITFVFTDFPSLRKLGLIIALGVSVAFILSVTVLPVLMQWWPLRKRPADGVGQRIITSFADFTIKRYQIILPVALLSSVLVASAMSRGVVDESFQNLFDPKTQLAKTINLADEKMAGLLQLDVAVFIKESGEQASVTDPEFLATLDAFKSWALSQPKVTHVQSITDTLKRLNRSMHGDDDAWYRLPDTPELAAQYLLMYEMSLPTGLDLSHQVTLDKRASRVVVSAKEVRSETVLKLADDIEMWFAENAPQYRVIATGLVKLMSEVTMYELIPKMARGAILAILMVSLVLFFALRSWVLGVFGMLANVVPIAVGYGIWALSGQIYNFVVIAVAGICLGMVVDFAVHFLDKFRSSYKREGNLELAIHNAFNRVASPITITAFVLMAGFYVLSFTKTATFSGLGLMTPLIIFLALVFDLLVLPALLMAIYKWRSATVIA